MTTTIESTETTFSPLGNGWFRCNQTGVKMKSGRTRAYAIARDAIARQKKRQEREAAARVKRWEESRVSVPLPTSKMDSFGDARCTHCGRIIFATRGEVKCYLCGNRFRAV